MDQNTNGTTLVGKVIICPAGEEIGRVKAVKGGYFHVDAPFGPGYWLSTAYIIHAPPGAVLISLPKSAVPEHSLDAPGLEPAVVPGSGRESDLFISDEEALAQRELIERQLSRQRRRRHD